MSAGQKLARQLREAIDQCDVCIFLATPRSIRSGWCLAELGAFWGAGKKVVIYVADPTVEETDLPPQFNGDLWTNNANKVIAAVEGVRFGRVERTSNGYKTALGSVSIDVSFGKIEEADVDDCTLMALPANEYFDDECIHDRNSALGSYMQHFFTDKIADIQNIVQASLSDKRSESVEKKPGEFAESYGVGECVYLDQPFESEHRIAMVSVTTQRKDLGLQAAPAYIFDAAEALCHLMANSRLTRLCVPILGSGHGGLKPEISLVCMLVAFGELAQKPAGRHLRDLNIVIYRAAAGATPIVGEASVRRALDFVSRNIAR